VNDARLYGADGEVLGGLNAFYLLRGEPEVYGLPSNPQVPSATVARSTFWAVLTGFLAVLGALFKFRERTQRDTRQETRNTREDPTAARPEEPA
jgi:formate dehydrogenase iron-sulfur subunit